MDGLVIDFFHWMSDTGGPSVLARQATKKS